jgi:biotin synthase-related radical SAM superfamily protein
MSDKKETAVEYLVEQLIPKALSVEQYYHIRKALEMESKKQQKYDEMLAMLEECLNIIGDVPLGLEMTEWHKNAEQLINEAKEL